MSEDRPDKLQTSILTVKDDEASVQRRTQPLSPEDKQLDRGEAVGRYLVLDVIGEGGMGVVYAAYDPELDRKVAIKLLQARQTATGSRGDQAWLLREAQAMARLQHPNVIAVHDVGTLSGDRVFVAMELVDGTTLREWSRVTKRAWREVVAVLRAAGVGLAAAHAAGLVHRDFKPENVLVGGDGRVRVMDFGLARLEDAPASRDSDVSITARSPLSANLAIDGIAGTPAYMAPEIHTGVPAGARTDQFAFGVALYEALYRQRPYDKDALIAGTATAPKAAPADSDVPTRIARVAVRAAAVDPQARYASMDALLADLADAPVARRGLVVGGGIALVGIGAVVALLATRGSGQEPCIGTDRLAGVWDERVKEATRVAFTATKSPLAADAFTTAARELDHYATAFADATTESCRATRVRGEQPEDAMALRATCFDERREELKAFTGLLAKADAAIVERAGRAVAALEPLARCANIAALRAPGAPPAEARAGLGTLRSQLADAKAGMLAGKTEPALAAVTAALATAKSIGWGEAEAQNVRGRILQQAGKAADGLEAFALATWAGERARRDDIVADAALWAAFLAADGLGKDSEARIWLGLGDAAAQRSGDRLLDVRRLAVAGVVAGARGDYVAAVAAHQAALDAATKLADPEGIATAEGTLAATLAKTGDYVKAAPHYERALAFAESRNGKNHPDVALLLSNLGACYDHAGDTARAKEVLARSLVIREGAFGSTSPRLLSTLNNLADLQRHTGDVIAGLATIDRALAIAEKVPGPKHPLYHLVATTRAEVLATANKLDEARTAFDAVLALEEEGKSPVLPTTLASRAELALTDRAWADAVRLEERAIALMETASGKEGADLWKPLLGLARAKAALGDAAAAKTHAQRSLAIGRAARVSDAELAAAIGLAR